MQKSVPSFWQMARRPKWIGALLLSLAVASIFALLGQWQLDRSFTKDANIVDGKAPISEVSIYLDTAHVYVVANRMQNDTRGFWVISNATDDDGKSLTVAHGWLSTLEEALAERQKIADSARLAMLVPTKGTLLPSEAPQRLDPANPYVLQSLSLAQLVNLYSPDKAIESNDHFFALQNAVAPLQAIEVKYQTGAAQINWLSAFYALEWTVFAGFAVFLWWRLVKDAIVAERLN